MARILLLTLALIAVSGVQQADAQWKNIYEALVGTPQLSILKAAVDALNASSLLQNPDLTWTVFAPTDTAFGEALTNLELNATSLLGNKPVLADLIEYHIVPIVSYTADKFPQGSSQYATLNGPVKSIAGGLEVVRKDSSVTVIATGSIASVTTPNVKAGKSVIHLVDAVLYPFYQTIAQCIELNQDVFSLLGTALALSGQSGAFEDPKAALTVFAPVDEGVVSTLTALGINATNLLADPDRLTSVLQYHVVPKAVASTQITNLSTIPTLNGKTLKATLTGPYRKVQLDTVGGQKVKVLIADVPVGPGPKSIIHVIDQIMIPAYTNVVNALTKLDQFWQLISAVVAEGSFVSTLSDPNFVGTIFAPQDGAFGTLAGQLKVNVSDILANKDLLKKVLSVHVVPGIAVPSSAISDGQQLTTLSGPNTLTAYLETNGVFIKSVNAQAKVINANIAVLYGRVYIHAIDRVLLPAGVPS